MLSRLFKYHRIAALRYVIQSWTMAQASTKVLRPVLGMGAIAVHMLNAVIYRPGEKMGEVELELTCCTHQPSEPSDPDFPGTTPVGTERGLFFVSNVLLELNIYRLPVTHTLSKAQLTHIFRVNN